MECDFYESSWCLWWLVSMNLGILPVSSPQDGLERTQTNCHFLGCVPCREEHMCLGHNASVGHQTWTDIQVFPIKEHWWLSTQMVKAFTFAVLSEAVISASSHDNNALGILENTHSTAQRQTLQMISSEGAGFQTAGSWSREWIKDWTSYEKLSNHRFP